MVGRRSRAITIQVMNEFAQDARSLRRAWALSGLVAGGILLLAQGSHAHSREPGIVILCESGGVSRAVDGGFLASGGPCVLHDRQGGHATADVIVVYDNAASAP
jgi:hypothetical protein